MAEDWVCGGADGLAAVRERIDDIDAQLLTLLLTRAGAVADVAKLKAGAGGVDGIALRPARESAILRRLQALYRDSGATEPGFAAIARIWREIISSATAQQTPFRVALYAPEGAGAPYWRIARHHFGGAPGFTRHVTAAAMLNALTDSSATVGLAPLPFQPDSDETWWTGLLGVDARAPKVIAKLPFWDGPAEMLAIAHAPLEPSGDDLTLVAMEAVEVLSHAELAGGLERVSISGRIVSQCDYWRLFELEGFHAHDPAVLAARFAEAYGPRFARLSVLGAYAAPLG